MPKMKKAKGKTKKTAMRRPARKKAAKKKALRAKGAAKKKTVRKKAAGKKTAIKRARGKTVARPAPAMPAKPVMVEPGPPPAGIPPVEEPTATEEAIGTVTHYYSHLGVAVVQLNKGTLSAGDSIHIQGHTTNLVQTVESMEYEHQHITRASAGQSVGIKVVDHVREHDIVFHVKGAV